MKNSGRRNVRKHREIENGEKYITLNISFKLGSLVKMKITSSEPKDYLGISGKSLITSVSHNTNGRSKGKKARYAIISISIKDLSSIIKEFGKFPHKCYVQKNPK